MAQGTHFYLITLDVPGEESATLGGTLTPGSEDTELDIYELVKNAAADKYRMPRNSIVLFWVLKPNQI